jgi:hypothetical protein
MISLIITSVFVPLLVSAVEYKLGVRDGDWVKYGQITVSWSGNGTEPELVTEEKGVEWIRVDFENVSGTTVFVNITTELNNGTQLFENDTEDVSGNSGPGGAFVIASNLKSGDPIANQSGAPTINQTRTGRYAGTTRTVNLIEEASTPLNQTVISNATWDQSAGVLVETYSKISYPPFGSGNYIELDVKATETNLWSPDLLETVSDNRIYIISGIIVAIIVIATAAVLRWKKTKTPPKPPEQAAREESSARARLLTENTS